MSFGAGPLDYFHHSRRHGLTIKLPAKRIYLGRFPPLKSEESKKTLCLVEFQTGKVVQTDMIHSDTIFPH
jgi:hypothetical protein